MLIFFKAYHFGYKESEIKNLRRQLPPLSCATAIVSCTKDKTFLLLSLLALHTKSDRKKGKNVWRKKMKKKKKAAISRDYFSPSVSLRSRGVAAKRFLSLDNAATCHFHFSFPTKKDKIFRAVSRSAVRHAKMKFAVASVTRPECRQTTPVRLVKGFQVEQRTFHIEGQNGDANI